MYFTWQKSIIGLFIFCLCHLFQSASAQEPLFAIKGSIDASERILESKQRLSLPGQWCFNWQEFINVRSICPHNSVFIEVPSKWNKLGDASYPRQGYASYSARIQLPKSEQPLALFVPTLYRAAHVFIDGELVHEIGKPGINGATETPSDASSIIPLPLDKKTIDIVIHTSSFSHIDGGINQPLELALLGDLRQYERIRSASSIFLVGSSLSFALYFLFIGVRGTNRVDWVYLTGSMTIFALSLRVIGVEQIWLLLDPKADANWILRYEYYGLYLALPACLFFLRSLFPENTNLKACIAILALGVLSTLLTTFAPSDIYAWLRDPWIIIYPIGFLYIIYVIANAIFHNRQYAKVIGIFMCIVVLSTMNDYLLWFQIYAGRSMVNITYLAIIAGNITVLMIRMIRASRMEEVLVKEVNELNVNLQNKVLERTAQLKNQQTVLETQNEKLLQMDKLKSQFLANISHEFRTPLTLIKGPLRRILSGEYGKLNPDTLNALQVSNRNVGRLSRLMEELLMLSHLESNQLRLQVQAIEINSFCRRISSLFEHQAAEQNLTFTTQFLSHDLVLFFDPNKMETLLCNLLSNAFKYTPSQGAIHFKISSESPDESTGNACKFNVCDTGPGIPIAMKERIFERFYRMEQDDKGAVEGSGIGLSLVRELADIHGGRVSVTKGDKGGSDFEVELPLGYQHFSKDEFSTQLDQSPNHETITPVSSTQDSISSDNTNKPKLLLVEDVKDMRDYIKSHFDNDYNVVTAVDGQKAWGILQRQSFDVVVTDVMMPVMSGLDLLDNIRQHKTLNTVPVLILSARSTNEDRNHALSNSADDYLAKPFDSQELTLRVRNLINRSATPCNIESRKPEISPSVDEVWLEQATKIILDNIQTSCFDSKQLAQALNMSKPTLHRHMERAGQTTPAAFMRNIRLEKAHQLIESNTYRTLAEVAYSVGFSSPGYFSRLYKQRYS